MILIHFKWNEFSNNIISLQVSILLSNELISSFFVESYEWLEIEKRQDCKQLENYLQLLSYTDRRQVWFNRRRPILNSSLSRLHMSSSINSILVHYLNWIFAMKMEPWKRSYSNLKMHKCCFLFQVNFVEDFVKGFSRLIVLNTSSSFFLAAKR